MVNNLDTACSYLEIDGKVIGPHKPTYFIAEAGLNHNTDIKLAKKLIEEAHNCGADAVKFQTFKSEKFLTPTSSYYNGFKQAELSYDKFAELKDFAKSVGITFFSAPFDIESADFLKEIGVQCFKIASGDFTDLPLIRHVAKMNVPMIISTGVANMEEVEEVVNLCMFESNKKIALLHCIAHYPTDPEEANLLAMDTMRKKFHVPVGYSDNGESLLVDIVAASMGANLIEKLISKIRIVESMHGDGIKAPQISEMEVRQDIRKSITAAEDISENEIITAEKLLTKRPAIGIKPKYFERVVGKKANKKIKKDTAIQWEDLS